MALGIVVVGGNMDPADYYDKTTADTKFLTGITKQQVINALGYTPPKQDTTYGYATTSREGLMSAADKQKLDGLSSTNAVSASGSNYIRFSNGIQICWGTAELDTTFPVAFCDTSYGIATSNGANSSSIGYIAPSNKFTTGCKIMIAVYVRDYVAVGRWK